MLVNIQLTRETKMSDISAELSLPLRKGASLAFNRSVGIVFFTLATILGAFVRIPVPGTPVPITLQTFFVLLGGAILGRRWGSMSQAAYLLLGIAGAPIFQGCASGMMTFLSPTGGYLIGFLLASYIVGALLLSMGSSRTQIIAAFSIGCLAIYASAFAHLALVYHMTTAQIFTTGILPFIPGDIMKVLLASLIYEKTSARAREIFSI